MKMSENERDSRAYQPTLIIFSIYCKYLYGIFICWGQFSKFLLN